MRLPLFLMIIAILINIAIDVYINYRLKKCALKNITKAHFYIAIVLSIFIVGFLFVPHRTGNNSLLVAKMWCLFGYFTFYIPKYVYIIFSGIEHLPLLIKRKPVKYIGRLGAVLGCLVFISLWWGALYTRVHLEVVKSDLKFENLPKSFDGYKIVQISDLHVGSYGDDASFVDVIVDSVNQIKPDLVVFTGDLVNRNSSELIPFVNSLSQIQAKDGVYSILGNHDYGDYMDWSSDELKIDDCRQFEELQSKMGWKLLNNTFEYIYHEFDSIALIGVENWGDPPFKTYADLSASYPDLNDGNFKILLSHNPAHWRAEVLDKTNIDLMLSGHTHAMQVMLRLGDIKLSPAYWRYAEWGGLYKEGKQQLYVNIGLGGVAIPMRLGAVPEITLITLHNE